MNKTLMIMEVSGKQGYIFSSKKLQENAKRSEEIAYITGGTFFREVAGDLYDEKKNLIYSGGGHTVLQFDDENSAGGFAQAVSEAVLRHFDGLEYFVKLLPYEAQSTPAENLHRLTGALERKKALRRNSFGVRTWGVEKLDLISFSPKSAGVNEKPTVCTQLPEPPEGWEYPLEFEELTGKDNFIAVIHIDGNAMGARVRSLYEKNDTLEWDDFCAHIRRFSEGIQSDFEAAFYGMTEAVIARRETWTALELNHGFLPVRPVILAGDDICFVAAGSLGLECARVFLEQLADLNNPEDGLPYAACAGVALVHQKFPFHMAYALAEELCSNAKRLGASIDGEGRISAMDWHIEFGQLKDGLSEIRNDYRTEDGGTLELRPVTVRVPEGVNIDPLGGVRTWDFFKSLCSAMKREYGKVARSKIKNLRGAFKQGEVEGRFFLANEEVSEFLDHVFDAEHGDDAVGQAFDQMRREGKLHKEAFREIDGVKRCLFFDAIEMIDHCIFLEGVQK